jgi:hypothetical protein
MKNTLLLSAILLMAQGCSSINQPTASRALVEDQFVVTTAPVNESLSAALSGSPEGYVLAIHEQPMVIGSKFFAAIGLTCRKLSSMQTGQDIYCLNEQGGWFKVSRVISEYNENNLREAGL